MAAELVPAQITHTEIKQALKHDPEFFIQFFLGEELTFPVPEFHPEIFALMINMQIDKFACAIPRDHAKTTLAKLACVWFFLFTDFRFILYLSNTVSIAVPSVNDVIAFMQCDNFKTVFGEIRFEIQQDGKGIYKFWLGDKLCILRAFGMGQQVRGINIDNQRPQLAILDDIDATQNEVTETSFKQAKRWFYGPFRKALDKFKNKMVQIGNLTETQSLIAENCQSRFWHSRVYGCLLADGKPLWPDAWPIEKLIEDYNEYLENGMADVWFAEMMNMPTAGGRGVILPEEICYAPHRQEDDIKYGFITVDLAISEETWAHKTVVAVHGWVEDGGINGQWQAIDYSGFTGIDPINLFWEVIRLCKKWKIRTVGIESVAYQASLKYVFQHECLRNGIEFNESTAAGQRGIAFVQLHAIGRKAQRIISWASMVKAKEYAINYGDFVLTQELLTYRPDRKINQDDHIDAYAYAPQMLQNFMFLIMQEYDGSVGQTAITGSYKLCSD
ncbi:MAG: hypothetical protein BV456_05940 [Thermoplasmata archaeon M8B2D]|nr:MAG: hypothetical protein BV456_05940 [Thermoplasmata archaeon M8B2D]